MKRKNVLMLVGVAAVASVAIGAAAFGARDRDGGDGFYEERGGGRGHHGWRHRGGGEDGGWHGRGEGRGHGRRGGGWGRQMTPEQFETRMRERFAGLDKNSDGIVDRAEIEAKMAERGARRGGGMGRGGDGMGRGGQRMLRRLGADESGTLTKEAFDARIKTAFARVDLNSDGKITDADLPPMMRGRGVLGGDAAGFGPGRGMGMRGRHGGRGGHGMAGGGFGGIHGLIQAAAKGKGDATLNDVLAVAETRFKWLDRNGDGKVDRADGEALRKEMADYRVQRFLHRFEATQSGQITREQFMKVATARFAERQAMRSHRGGEGRGWGRGRGRGGDSDMGRDGERDAPSAGGENDPGRDDTTAPRRN